MKLPRVLLVFAGVGLVVAALGCWWVLQRQGQSGQKLVSISAGSFTMGSDDASEEESPAHEVTVAAFEIDRLEVSAAQFDRCVAAGKCEAPHDDYPECSAKIADAPNHPVSCVSHAQATAYCEFQGARLPSEAEWEYAARGTDGRGFPWGNEHPLGRACYLRQRDKQQSCDVGSNGGDESPFGVLDMAGNVSEWTSSPYCSYAEPDDCKPDTFVTRGGSWDMDNPFYARTTTRDWVPSAGYGYNLGFRCARSLGR